MRKMLVSALLIAVVGLTFASKGGGGEKKKDVKQGEGNDRAPL